MRAHERESVLVILDGLQRGLPAVHRMAFLALQSQLALVNVSVAVRALRAHIGKHQTDMALGAGDALVHRPQRISSFVVIELKDVAKRLP